MVEISKLSLRSMLYPGATTKIRAHFMGWFGDNGHVNPGYKSNDPARVSLQVTDMKASGIDSAILDWYGQFNPTINGTGLLLKAESERRKDFDVVLCYDYGLLRAKPANLSDTDYLIQQIKYSKATYMSSPQYGRVKDGRLLALEFGLSSVDWARIVALCSRRSRSCIATRTPMRSITRDSTSRAPVHSPGVMPAQVLRST
jgi:hypothetical protein